MPRLSPLIRLFACLIVSFPLAANAILSQPDALINSGPVRVVIDVELGEASKLLSKESLRSHVEERLEASGVPVTHDDQNLPSVVSAQQREPSEIRVHLAARQTTGAADGYILSMEVSHLQPAILQRAQALAVTGLDWQESWASITQSESDVLSATRDALDPLIDDFAKDYQAANRPPSSQ